MAEEDGDEEGEGDEEGGHARSCRAAEERKQGFVPLLPTPHTTRQREGTVVENLHRHLAFCLFAVFALPLYMATLARSAPLPGSGTPVEAPQFQDIVLSSRSLVQKILLSVPDTHKSCIHLEVRDVLGAWCDFVLDVFYAAASLAQMLALH